MPVAASRGGGRPARANSASIRSVSSRPIRWIASGLEVERRVRPDEPGVGLVAAGHVRRARAGRRRARPARARRRGTPGSGRTPAGSRRRRRRGRRAESALRPRPASRRARPGRDRRAASPRPGRARRSSSSATTLRTSARGRDDARRPSASRVVPIMAVDPRPDLPPAGDQRLALGGRRGPAGTTAMLRNVTCGPSSGSTAQASSPAATRSSSSRRKSIRAAWVTRSVGVERRRIDRLGPRRSGSRRVGRRRRRSRRGRSAGAGRRTGGRRGRSRRPGGRPSGCPRPRAARPARVGGGVGGRIGR